MWKSLQLTNMNELQREIRKFKFRSFLAIRNETVDGLMQHGIVIRSHTVSWNAFIVPEKSENQAKTNTNLISPNFIVSVMAKPGKSDRKVLASSSVMNKNTQKPIQKWIQMHGRANQSRNTTFKHFWRSWGLLKIPHQGGRGCGSRLSIWWWLELYLFWPSK